MPTRTDLMHVSHQQNARRSEARPVGLPPTWANVPSSPAESRDLGERDLAVEEYWDGPTLRELVDRVEHQFGQMPALAGVYMLGFGRDEPLTPGDIQAVCDHLGLPATDFGLDP